MKDFAALAGALLVNLVLLVGVVYLPPVGVQSLENIYVFVWLAFGLLINLGFLRKALNIRRRRRKKAPRLAPPPEAVRKRQYLA